MSLLFRSLLSVLAVSHVSVGAALFPRATTSFDLQAFGTNNNGTTISESSVFYADGTAYVGSVKPANASAVYSIFLAQSTSDPTSLVISEANLTSGSNSTTNDVVGSLLSINTTATAYESVTFTSSDNSTNTTSSGLTTSGFRFYGSSLIWRDDNSSAMESLFYAWPVAGQEEEDIWILKWNTEKLIVSKSIPVALREE
ncbi:putative cytochrome p450 [Phaeomoniella chlamydospora]|uniref:Putative cytochrome p450 n=1 Tax=Phaeomoniella chlamydospora TaxID=158046 RepID=A0A0G2E8E0_PHACM|nr:putative cytochrome p450 [Phaeomoniella chlamydospora]